MMIRAFLIAALFLGMSAGAVSAQEFREIGRINTPDAGLIPDGAEISPVIEPVPNDMIRDAVENLVETWNAGEVEPLLVDTFEEKERLDETIVSSFPRDAELRLLSMGAPETLVQYRENGVWVAKVAVDVRTQIEFRDESGRLRRAPGLTRFILRVQADGMGGQ